MKDFIDSFGYRNFIILLVLVVLIVIALIVLFIVDRVSNRKSKLQDEDFVMEFGKISNEEKKTLEDEKVLEKEVVEEEEKSHVVYIDKANEEELAKKTLNDTFTKLKKLEEEKVSSVDLIENTNFEKEQEEKSIISYEELKEASKYVDETNDMLLEDEGNEPITIDELYRRHEESQYEDSSNLSNPVFTDTYEEVNKFKKSEVISPVFGVYKKNYDNYSVSKYYNTMDLKDIEEEIRKTEEFLKELKKIKDKLD